MAGRAAGSRGSAETWNLLFGSSLGAWILLFGAFWATFPPVTTKEAIELLEKFRAGGVGRDQVLRAFQAAPVADLGFAQVDLHRALRKGFPEVIFGARKTPHQVLRIAAKLLQNERRLLVTRITPEHARARRQKIKHAD